MNKVGAFVLNSKTTKNSKLAGSGVSQIPRMINGKPNPAYKLNLSEKSKKLQNQLHNQQQKPQTKPQIANESNARLADVDVPVDSPSTPDAPKVDVSDVKDIADKAKKSNKAKEMAKAAKAKFEQAKLKTTPAIFFIKAFEFIETDIFANGMKSMAQATEGARYYGWDQKKEMIEQIKMRNQDQPVILVGHGFGADTAVEIAQELNTIENGFRKIDLLVTLNSSGLDNDFIPENVRKNLNYITADNGWSDDGPNIALDYHRTKVENFLRPEGHDDLDDATTIQIDILDSIKGIVQDLA